jgi:hypothetical protein
MKIWPWSRFALLEAQLDEADNAYSDAQNELLRAQRQLIQLTAQILDLRVKADIVAAIDRQTDELTLSQRASDAAVDAAKRGVIRALDGQTVKVEQNTNVITDVLTTLRSPEGS